MDSKHKGTARTATIVHHAKLTGWGRTATSRCEIWKPVNLQQVRTALESVARLGAIGRGCGRSYGDVSTNNGGRVIDMTAMNNVDYFDSDSGVIWCQAGVTMNQLIKTYLHDGYISPVCPGTGFVTVAGAVAHDVHGKNHDKHGSFGDHVEWIELLLPSGDLLRVGPKQHPELFQATIGGAGLTGLIIRVAFKLINIGTNAVRVHEERKQNLDELMPALAIADKKSTFSVGWVDAQARGDQLGRGILITGEAAESFLPTRGRLPISIPFNLPSWTINRATVKIFNGFYYHRIGKERVFHTDFERFVHPLDALLHWNRLYGSKGVYQFQCVIPHDNAQNTMRELLDVASKSGTASPLAVMKTLSRKGRGFLSFPRPGFTLALDFPRTRHTASLIKQLHTITLTSGGRVYLAKDSLLMPEQFRKMYPYAVRFERILDEIDPDYVMQSDMSRRLALHMAAKGKI